MIKRKMQIKMMRLLSGLIFITIFMGGLIFLSLMEYVFFHNMNQTSILTVEQISSSFELVLSQIADKTNKLGLYDGEWYQLVDARENSVLDAINLYRKLDSMVLENQYLHSAYLYSEKDDLIFDSKRGCQFAAGDFYDKEAVTAAAEKRFTRIRPRVVQSEYGKKDVIYSIVVLLSPHRKSEESLVLCLNVDMSRLYMDIMKKANASGDVALYLYDTEGRIITGPDIMEMGTPIDKIRQKVTINAGESSFWDVFIHKNGIMDAQVYSKPLAFYFYLQVPFTIKVTAMFNQYLFLFLLLMIFSILVLVVYMVSRHTTKPLDAFLVRYHENVLRGLLSGSSVMSKWTKEELENIEEMFLYEGFAVLMIEVDQEDRQKIDGIIPLICASKNQNKKMIFKSIIYRENRIVVICNMAVPSLMAYVESDYSESLSSRLAMLCGQQHYLVVSSYRKGYEGLAQAVKECEEMLEFKLSLAGNVLTYVRLSKQKGTIPYPEELERQLINNILVGNLENSLHYLDKYMSYFFDNEYVISDMAIKTSVYQFQTELLKHLSSLPLSVKTPDLPSVSNVKGRAELNEILALLIDNTCNEISRKNQNNESVFVASILDYINSHLTDDDFNLNSLAFQFNLNRNYLARVIKESTNYSFNDYVNLKKVSLAKKLLTDNSQTIEQIAHAIGYSYSHYFIKVFKSIEGITPGKYRETLGHNNNAQPLA